MKTVAPPGKYNVSPVLVITVTDGGPNWRITSARGVPTTGNEEPTAGAKGGLGKMGFAGKKMFDDGLTGAGGKKVCPG
jgi:hypothetical protein